MTDLKPFRALKLTDAAHHRDDLVSRGWTLHETFRAGKEFYLLGLKTEDHEARATELDAKLRAETELRQQAEAAREESERAVAAAKAEAESLRAELQKRAAEHEGKVA